MAERKVDVLTVRWYERAARSPDIVTRWLGAAREHLPEAMPRRFGDVEPLRGRLDRDGEDGFRRGHEQADTLFFLAGTAPVYSGSLSARKARYFGPTVAHSLHAVLEPGDDRVRRFALALTHPATVYVSASVNEQTLDRGELWGGPDEQPFLAPLGEWLGLPPTPPAWCWFGPAYTRMVRRRVSGSEVAGGLLWTGGTWVDERLTARMSEVDPVRRHAARMPGGLRRNTLQVLLGAFR
ncbi:hypothetical protein [Actinoplanes sp. CA-252034]|uniref:hypothetical protein n=1 Tax=Actinoplanes sp. CA-252034 TaxID=3239906 RepID=UPI003D964DE9